jgi:hypothetical protein
MLAWILADVIMAPTLTSSGCLARVGTFTIINSKANSSQVLVDCRFAAIKLIQSLNHEMYCDFQQYKIESKKLLLYLI